LLQGQVKKGFFIEAGAVDFEQDSNSLYFEENPSKFSNSWASTGLYSPAMFCQFSGLPGGRGDCQFSKNQPYKKKIVAVRNKWLGKWL